MALLSLIGVALLAIPAGASASTTFGSLSNFDVFNDTGEVTHGFEIELDGISSSDVVYTFGAPYERYGDPVVTDFPGGVYVRYMSPYDANSQSFTEGTPIAPSPITPTMGHDCWTGASPNYPASGCEHFGISLAKDPTNTVYRWLVADPANPGSLTPAGTKVSIPAPSWSVAPAPPAAPNPAPVVRAVIAPPEPGAQEFGDAQWVKVYVTESANPADLDHLVTDDPAVPQEPAEVETEWVLLQEDRNNPGANDLLEEAQMQPGNESVTRRYEFYDYTGAYDPETHEALPINSSTPDPADIGDYKGAQMAAVNVNQAAFAQLTATAGPLPDGEAKRPYSAPLVTGGTPPMTATMVKGRLPRGLSVDANGNLAGTPTGSGIKTFTVTVTDADGNSVTAQHTILIYKPLRITTTTAGLPLWQVGVPYSVTLSAAGGLEPYEWSEAGGTLPDGLSFDDTTATISGTPLPGAVNSAVQIRVTDAFGFSVTKKLTLKHL